MNLTKQKLVNLRNELMVARGKVQLGIWGRSGTRCFV